MFGGKVGCYSFTEVAYFVEELASPDTETKQLKTGESI